MGFIDEAYQKWPTREGLPTFESLKNRPLPPRLQFLKRRIRLTKGSAITLPLGVLIAFPLIVFILIGTLFINHSDGEVKITIPGRRPPAIRRISEKYDKPFVVGCQKVDNTQPRANAVIVVLARNSELEGMISSMKSFERHFNRWFNYPYLFFNDGEFNETFKAEIQAHTKSEVSYAKIGSDMWGIPDWTDKEAAREGIALQGDRAIMYGGMESYHSMCRFYSGHFYNHPALEKYKWYWRLEPDIKYFCDITYDPFLHMERTNKTYGFTIALKELKETVPNMFRYASAYMRSNNIKSQGLWEMFLEKQPEKKKEDQKSPLPEEVLRAEPGSHKLPDIDPENMEGEKYNMCHFWSNFEIARLDFYRSPAYQNFFEMMDKSGGFWMERWGDAPIHSLATGILLGPSDLHYFRDFGYRHTTIQHCPANAPTRQLPREKWIEETTVKKEGMKKAIEEDAFFESWDTPRENGVGCRCKCDTDITDVEGKPGSCLEQWVEVTGGWTSP